MAGSAKNRPTEIFKSPAESKADVQMLVARVEQQLPPGYAVTRRMFGGVTFMRNGNMLCCVSKRGLMARVGAAAEAEALSHPHVSPCMGAGRSMAGFVMIDPPGFAAEADLLAWLGKARAYVETLPPKP